MDDLVQAMGGTGISKSQVSRLCEELDERVNAFLDHPIEDEWLPGGPPDQAPQHQLAGATKRRDRALDRGGQHLPQRDCHHPFRRRDPAGAERRVGRPARPLHDPGKHRLDRRWFPRRTAHPDSLTDPAQPVIVVANDELHHTKGRDCRMAGRSVART
ncbi:protein of unknown function [Methylorubrum extorquens]|uniref:Transposase n=1 Tax=Methylorubrum extorquens TaxID=408 RepID=A0A2N9AYX5_METEX|nr:protein of unknown function [Methylorubrum extorquens]